MFIRRKVEHAYSVVVSKVNWLVGLYFKIQIYNKGEYSIERLQSLKGYCEKASFLRVLFVCFLTPLPALIVPIGIDMIPLASPLHAWDESAGIWIRLFLLAIFVSMGWTLQLAPFLRTLHITRWHIILLNLGASSTATGVYILAAARWTFPFPFGIMFIAFPFTCTYIFLLLVFSDWKSILSPLNRRKILWQEICVLILHVLTIVIYVAFNAAFQMMEASQQVFAVPLLPVLKIFMKNVYAWAFSHRQETIPELTIFSVEVFNALFVSISMQTAQSIATSIAIIAIDAAQIICSLLEMQHDSKALLTEMKRLKTTSSSENDLLVNVFELGNKFSVKKRILPNEMKSKSETRAARPTLLGSLKTGPLPLNLPMKKVNSKVNQVVAYQNEPPGAPAKEEAVDRSLTSDFSTKVTGKNANHKQYDIVVDEALKLLFHVEYCLLSEYCEVVLPIIYLAYLLILHQLPNAVYYEHSRNLTNESLPMVVTNLSVFILLEVLSLVFLHYLLKNRFNFSPVHQLAYVLEGNFHQIQGRMTAFVVYALGFTLMHFGVDFTFKFNWAEQLASAAVDSP